MEDPSAYLKTKHKMSDKKWNNVTVQKSECEWNEYNKTTTKTNTKKNTKINTLYFLKNFQRW